MKQLTSYADYGVFIFNIPELKTIKEFKINEELTIFITNIRYYFDTIKLKYRLEHAPDGYSYIYFKHKDIYFQETYKRDEVIETMIADADTKRILNILKDWIATAKDFTIMSFDEVQSFISSIKKQQEERIQQKRKEREEKERQKQLEAEKKHQEYIKQITSDFINNKEITGEGLHQIMKNNNCKIPLKTQGSIKNLVSVIMRENGCFSYRIYKGKKMTDNMSSIIRNFYNQLKEEQEAAA